MSVLIGLIGVALLFLGRKVFWLFVAGAGFVAGMAITSSLFHGPEWVAVLIGLGIGFLAALLAIVLQRFAIGLAGFLAGGYLALQFLVPLFHLEHGWLPLLAFGVGGVLGLILVSVVLDWALIALSSLAGAALLSEALPVHDGLGFLVFVVLVVIGAAYQIRELRRDRRKSN
jgi:hypothetical protein